MRGQYWESLDPWGGEGEDLKWRGCRRALEGHVATMRPWSGVGLDPRDKAAGGPKLRLPTQDTTGKEIGKNQEEKTAVHHLNGKEMQQHGATSKNCG